MNRKESEEFRQFTRLTIGSLAKKLNVRIEGGGKTIEMLGTHEAFRKLIVWGYRMAVSGKDLEPIENCVDKRAYWEEAKKYDLTKEERIEIAKGIYYLSNV